MGTCRLILALLVAIAHLSGVVTGIPAVLSGHSVFAVRAFFVLSGFYMALVLDDRYERPLAFYASRLLKLLPIYWLVSALTLATAMAVGNGDFPFSNPAHTWQTIDFAAFPITTTAYAIGSLFSLIGSETWTWIGFDASTGAWSLAPGFARNATSVLGLTGVPQAWTLGLELWFYLLAPFLVRLRTTWVLALIATSIALRLLYNPVPPFNRSIFPFELAFFLMGIVAFRWRPNFQLQATKFGRLDATLGALSYPAYMAHFLVFAVVNEAMRLSDSSWGLALLVALASLIAFSFVLDRAIARPIDRLRIQFGARPFYISRDVRPS